jgi:spore coat protein CotH
MGRQQRSGLWYWKKLIYPYFTNYNYQVDANTLYVNLNIKTDNQLKLDQFQWQEMPSKDIKDLKINSLSSNPSTSVNYYSMKTKMLKMPM